VTAADALDVIRAELDLVGRDTEPPRVTQAVAVLREVLAAADDATKRSAHRHTLYLDRLRERMAGHRGEQ